MGILSFNEEMPSKAAPAKLFMALVTDNHNLIPKVSAKYVKTIKCDADGKTKEVFLTEEADFPYVKLRIDEVDEAVFRCKYTIVEGGELTDTIKSITNEIKFEPIAEGGCLIKINKVVTIEDGAKLKPDRLKAEKLRIKMLFNRVEDYLLKNPDVYA